MPKSWALVTGASGGLGQALARDLARRGFNLVLVARSEAALGALAEELDREYAARVAVEPTDLSLPGSASALCGRLASRGIQPEVLVNNAAFGISGPFVESGADRLREMLQLDVVSLTELTHLIGRKMAARGRGRILLVGSLGAFSPTPLMAAYAAAKAYVLSLGEALHVELSPGVGVTVLSPGVMDTGFGAASGLRMSGGMRRTALPTAEVARIGLEALFAGRPSVIAGRLNRLSVAITGLFSRRARAKLSHRIFRAAVSGGNS